METATRGAEGLGLAMSYQQFQQKCRECGKTWNAAFGIVGTTIIAEPPKVCPYCKSDKIEHYATDGRRQRENNP